MLFALLGRFQQLSSEPESAGLYETLPSFLWEDSLPSIVDACVEDDMLLVMYKDEWFSQYSSIRCYELLTGNIAWEIDSLKTEKYPLFATLYDGMLFTCVHHPDSLTEIETNPNLMYYSFIRRVEDPGSSLYLLQCYDLQTGELINQFATGVLPAKAPVLVTDGMAVLLFPGAVSCYSVENGEQVWYTVLNDAYTRIRIAPYRVETRLENNPGCIVVNQETLYLAEKNPYRGTRSPSPLMNLFSLSLDEGEILWSAFEEQGVCSGPDVHENELYLYSSESVCRRDTRTGELIWQRNYGSGFSGALWSASGLGASDSERNPFIYWNDCMLIPVSGNSLSDSVEVLNILDGALESVLPVCRRGLGMYLLEGQEGDSYLLSSEKIGSNTYLTLRSLPGLERSWMYNIGASRFVLGEGFICALNRNSIMVFH